MRKRFFWLHLAAGCAAGIVILMMSVTGVLLTYERQTIEWVERGYRVTPQGERVPLESLLNSAIEGSRSTPASVTIRKDPEAPAELALAEGQVLLVNPYTGAVIGPGAQGLRAFFRGVTKWHRYFGAEGDRRVPARAVTGACNLAFLFLALSGLYLWIPKKWTRQHLKPVTWFRGGLSGKARDFNWHNVAGLWTALPLVLIIASGVVMSYPWANQLVFRITGSEAPPAPPRGPGRAGGGPDFAGIDTAWRVAARKVEGWSAISFRVPDSGRAPFSFTIDQSHRGRPDKRSTLIVARSGQEMRYETFDRQSAGRRLRTWIRWVHTGEAGGLVGQTVAGLASAAGALLVWTGISLALRRLRAYRLRSRETAQKELVLR